MTAMKTSKIINYKISSEKTHVWILHWPKLPSKSSISGLTSALSVCRKTIRSCSFQLMNQLEMASISFRALDPITTSCSILVLKFLNFLNLFLKVFVGFCYFDWLYRCFFEGGTRNRSWVRGGEGGNKEKMREWRNKTLLHST